MPRLPEPPAIDRGFVSTLRAWQAEYIDDADLQDADPFGAGLTKSQLRTVFDRFALFLERNAEPVHVTAEGRPTRLTPTGAQRIAEAVARRHAREAARRGRIARGLDPDTGERRRPVTRT